VLPWIDPLEVNQQSAPLARLRRDLALDVLDLASSRELCAIEQALAQEPADPRHGPHLVGHIAVNTPSSSVRKTASEMLLSVARWSSSDSRNAWNVCARPPFVPSLMPLGPFRGEAGDLTIFSEA